MSDVALRANFGDLLAPGFRMIFDKDMFGGYPPEYTSIFNIVSSSRQYEDDSSISGLGTIPEKEEGVGITYDSPIQGYNKRYTHKTYGMGFRVTREMMEDDLYSKMRKMPSALSRSMSVTIETDAANIYNRAFDSAYTGGDGKELCATDHPLTGGGTEQNELTNAADFTDTSLEQALIDIQATTDDRGLVLALRPMKLLVTPTGEWNAMKILKSGQDPDSANNAINPAKGALPGGIIVNHYLTDNDAWFILGDKHEVNWFWRRKPSFEQGNDFDTEDAKFKATARWSNGFTEWRGVFGSPGI
jgi:phage major head subunit gpT-like protein